jgi:hypothetical protein
MKLWYHIRPFNFWGMVEAELHMSPTATIPLSSISSSAFSIAAVANSGVVCRCFIIDSTKTPIPVR